ELRLSRKATEEMRKNRERGQIALPDRELYALDWFVHTVNAFQTNAPATAPNASQVRKGGLPPLAQNNLSFLFFLSVFLLLPLAASAQQIGNPTTQLGVTPPRGTYV